jgi:hypothetical protein
MTEVKNTIAKQEYKLPDNSIFNPTQIHFNIHLPPTLRPPPSSAEVKERVELYLYSPYKPTRPVLG